MTQVRFVMTIARKPQDVFDLVADITRNTEWAPGFTYAEKVTPGPVSLGSAFNTSAKGLGPMQIEIVEYERPTRLWVRWTRSTGRDAPPFHADA